VAAAALKLFAKPEERATAFVAVSDVKAAIALLNGLQGATGGLLAAFELLPRLGLEMVLAHIPHTRDPLRASSPWYEL
jgi:FAD/FMN-containing dehydrogenase